MYDRDIVRLFSKIPPPYTHEKINYFNNGVSKIVMRWNPVQTYVTADIWFLWSLFYHKAIPGAHSSQSIHNGVFLDGHAEAVYITAKNIQDWGAQSTGSYVPKDGDGWREYRNFDTKDRYFWNGNDPFGGGSNRQGVTGSGG
jgi:hypothetical protein